jgi:hypothetical protein
MALNLEERFEPYRLAYLPSPIHHLEWLSRELGTIWSSGRKGFLMRTWLCALLLATVTSIGCYRQTRLSSESRSLTPASAVIIEDGVRGFMQAVANDITLDGPAAWRKQFADSPSFFMAADGQMVFPNSAAATKGIHDLALDIKQIELVWSSDLRVDPLAPDLAVVAAPYREVRVNTRGLRVEDAGFFTGIVEYQDGRWQLRDCHWSVPAHPPAAPQKVSR